MAHDSTGQAGAQFTPDQIDAGVELLTGYLGDLGLSSALWDEVLSKLYMIGISPPHRETLHSIDEQLPRVV